jgi:hypothetical protein
MENPSLQIGNNNWAVKDGSILGYNIIQDNYLPHPIDFTRASSATRVNAEGLIETASILGSELVTNGDFATDSDWNKDTGVTISGGKANWSNTANNIGISQNGILSSGKVYRVEFTISNYSSGSLRVRYPKITERLSANGTYVYYITAENNNFFLQGEVINGNPTFSVDNVSVKEVITNNVPRIDYTGGGFGKLLLEPQRTNNLLQSNQFDTTWLNQLGGTRVGGQTNTIATSDDAWKLTKDAASGRSIRQSISLSLATYAYSAFLKSGTLANAAMRVDTSSGTRFMNIDLSIGTISSTSGTIVSTSIEDYGNGWYRCTMVVTESITNVHVYVGEFSGTIAGDIYCQRTQLEAGSYPTSYIPTSGTAVTRVKDSASKDSLSVFGTNVGSLFVDAEGPYYDGDAGYLFDLSDNVNSSINRFGVYSANSTNLTLFTNASLNFAASVTARKKIAVIWNGTNTKLYLNGVKVLDFTYANANPTSINLNSRYNESQYGNSKFNQVLAFPTALSDTDAITLTTL